MGYIYLGDPTVATARPVRRKQTLEQSMSIIRGDEPEVTKDDFKAQLLRALNWYNTNWEEKDYRKSAEAYVLKQMKMKDAAYALSKATFLEIKPIGVLGRLIMREQHVDLDYLQKLFESVEQLKKKYTKPKPVAAVQQPQRVVAAPATVQERITESARALIGDVEGALDEYATVGTDFSMKSFLVGNQVSGVVAKKIGEFYATRLAEIEEAIGGADPQLKEGYSNYTKRGLRQFAEFLRQLIADCNQQVVSAKAQRKPRARKAKPASVIVKKMEYKKEDSDLSIKSVSAEKIIGATELWVYNTATRKLIVFYGADNGYLGVSGKSITNYDIEKSAVKTLRDPEAFFKGLSSTGKRAMANAWKGIRARESKPRARINEEMVLLAAN